MTIHQLEKLEEDIGDLHCLIRTYQKFHIPFQKNQKDFLRNLIERLKNLEIVCDLEHGN